VIESDRQRWDPQQYAEHARFVSELGSAVLELLDPRPGECIIDLGCGDGALTAKLLECGCKVLATDASPDMVSATKNRGLNAIVLDGQALDFDKEFDAVFSNAALHWMKDQQKVCAGVWRALKPGGRFVAEFGAKGNVAVIVDALESALATRGVEITTPWYFPDPEEYRELLSAAGFTVTTMECFQRPTLLPGDIGGWLQTFAQVYLAALAQEDRSEFIEEIVEMVRPYLCDEKGCWHADYVRLRFSATRPAE